MTSAIRASRRVWSELLPYDVVSAPRTLRLVRRHDLALLVAVRPADLAALPELLARADRAGVRVGLWPMLDDAAGRWASAWNVDAFAKFVRDTLAVIDRAGAPVAEVALDLEPPIALVQAALGSRRGLAESGRALFEGALDGGRRQRFERASRGLACLAAELAARGLGPSVAAVPLVLLDPPPGAGDTGFQELLGTPVDALGGEHVSVMAYTSLLEGYSRGLVGRGAARALLAAACGALRARFGPRGGVSLGAVGPGALGDEPVYRDVAELVEDVGVARASGIEQLSLFDLAGVLARPPAEAWLEAFALAPASALANELSLGARLSLAAASSAVRLLAGTARTARGVTRVGSLALVEARRLRR